METDSVTPPSSSLPEPSEEITLWLSSIHLSQYGGYFAKAGFKTMRDCQRLTEERLVEMGSFPTGHRRRILSSLEVLGEEKVEGDDGRTRLVRKRPVPRPRRGVTKDRKRGTSCKTPQSHSKEMEKANNLEGRQTLPARTITTTATELRDSGFTMPRLRPQPSPRASPRPSPRASPRPSPRASPWPSPRSKPRGTLRATSPASSTSSTTSSVNSLSLSSHSLASDMENQAEEPGPSIPEPDQEERDDTQLEEPPGGFQGEMVENDIYECSLSLKAPGGPRPTRSYRLRHRPVPEIPERTAIPSHDWSVQMRGSMESVTSAEALPGLPSGCRALLEREMSPITPYGETFLYNNPENGLDDDAKEINEKVNQSKARKKKENLITAQRNKGKASSPEFSDDGYSTVQKHPLRPQRANEGSAGRSEPAPMDALPRVAVLPPPMSSDVYSEPQDAVGGPLQHAPPLQAEIDISPYACFYDATKSNVKIGWLDKLSPHGNYVFQRRWVKLDGENLSYYNNDKEMYSKGLIPVWAVKQVRGVGENKFEVITSQRTFVFRAEREGERQQWLETLQSALCSPASISQKPCKSAANRSGSLELRGHKGRVYASLAGTSIRLCKTDQDFAAGLAIAVVNLTAASVRHVDRRGFELTTPFKTFCFTAESEREREAWVEAVQECIVETLSDYEVAEKVWFNPFNQQCADCRAPYPEWASINLVVVICKKCAGQHRFLGSGISQVRSLKLDSSIWSNELVELFLEVGNDNSNSFWAANLPPEEELHMGASAEQRATFHRRKYRERKYRKVLEGLNDQEELNQALCASVLRADVLRSMALVFSGADVMCATGDAEYSTPYLLAQRASQRLQMEFLYHNKLSEFPKLEAALDCSFPADVPSFMDGFLYCSICPSKATSDRKGREDMIRKWCTLEGGFLSYYDNEKIATATGRVDISEVTSLAINNAEIMTGAGAVFTFETYLQSERLLVFGAETSDTQRDWAHAVAKCFVPTQAEILLRQGCELIGQLYYKEGHDLYHWRVGWFALAGSELLFCSGDEGVEKEVLQLKRLQELTMSTHMEGEERIQVLLMVESGRTIYVHGTTKQDFDLWHSAIQHAARTDGRALGNQQLSRKDVPIIVDSCMAFITQYGLCHEGIYQKKGDPARVALLLDDFRQDARNVKLRLGEHLLEDVTDTLTSFLCQAEDALLAKELYPYWVSVLDEVNEKHRVEKYSTLIQSLPRIHRSTLAAFLQHLYRIQSCSDTNGMNTASLASALSSCLFQTKGQNPQESRVVEDLINNYVKLFSVNEEQVRQMEKENGFIARWKDTTFSPAGDLIFEVYLEKKEPENCCLIKVSPSMSSDELVESTLEKKNVQVGPVELWTTFEVIENGELERPLHYKEKVLEQVLEWSALDDPSSAFLIIKKFSACNDSAPETNKDFTKGEQLKFKDGSSKLLSGHKFQDKYLALRDKKLLLFKDVKSTKPDREVPVELVKCYLGLKKKLKPATSWGFTVYTQKQHWYFCCEGQASQLDWVTSIIQLKHGADMWLRDGEKSRAKALRVRGEGTAPPQPSNEVNKISDRGVATAQAKTQKFTDESSRHHKNAPLENVLKPRESTGESVPKPRTAAHMGNRFDSGNKMAASVGTHPAARHGAAAPRPDSAPSHAPRGAPRAAPRAASASCPLPATHSKAAPKKAQPAGGRAHMPQNLLDELNAVISKTGRSTKEEN